MARRSKARAGTSYRLGEWSERLCPASGVGGSDACALERGHEGDHETVVRYWSETETSDTIVERGAEDKYPSGLKWSPRPLTSRPSIPGRLSLVRRLLTGKLSNEFLILLAISQVWLATGNPAQAVPWFIAALLALVVSQLP